MKKLFYRNLAAFGQYLRTFSIMFLLLLAANCSFKKKYPEIIKRIPIRRIRKELIERLNLKASPGKNIRRKKIWAYIFSKGKLTYDRFLTAVEEYDTLGRVSSLVNYEPNRKVLMKKVYHYANVQADSLLYIEEYICLGARKPKPDEKDAYTVTYFLSGENKEISKVLFHYSNTAFKDSLSPKGKKITEVKGTPGAACTIYVYGANEALHKCASFLHTRPQMSKEYSDGRLIDSTLYDGDGKVKYQYICRYNTHGQRLYEKEINHQINFIKTSHFEYDSHGLLLRKYSKYGHDEMIREEVFYHRDQLGRLVKRIDINHNKNVPTRGSCGYRQRPHSYTPTVFQYDKSGKLIEEIHFWSSDSLQNANRVKKRIKYTYSRNGYLIEELYINREGHESERLKYDKSGRWFFREKLGRGEDIKRTSSIKRQFDSLGNVIIEFSEAITDSGTFRAITYYDSHGNRIKEERLFNDSLIISKSKAHHYTDDKQLMYIEVDSGGMHEKIGPYLAYDKKGKLLRRIQYDSNNEPECIFEYLYDSVDDMIASVQYWTKSNSGSVRIMEHEYY